MERIINIVIATSITALIVLGLKAALKSRISPKWQFALWIVIGLRLLVPVLPESKISVLNALPRVENIEFSNKTVENMTMDNEPFIKDNIVIGDENKGFTLSKALKDNALNIWIAGSVIMFIYILGIYFIYHRKTRKFNIAEDDELYSVLDKCKKELGINAFIRIRTGGDTPLLKGIVRPEIILPSGYEKQELKSVFMHELMHFKHRDILWSLLSTLLLCAYWYNPIIWVCFSLFRRDMEILCDYRVLEVYDNRKLYASVLLKTAVLRNRYLLCATTMHNGEKDVSKRIKYIAYFKKPKVVWSIIGVAAAAIVAVICLTNPIEKSAIGGNGLDSEKLYGYRTLYVGNAGKVGGITGNLYYSKYGNGISLKTDSKPYGVTVNYKIKPEEIAQNGVVGVTDNMLKNAAVMFCLIDNVDDITFSFDNGNGIYTFTFDRKLFNELFGSDLREYSSSIQNFKEEFIPKIEKFNWEYVRKPGGPMDISISQAVERNLEIIMSSPKEASSTSAYINAHRNEYENILKMGDEALKYMLSQFESGEAKGLKGNIMMELCIDILGDRNNVKEGSYTSPQDWYEKLSPYTASKLPQYEYKTIDKTEQMVYSAAMKKYSVNRDDVLTIVAPHIFGTYESGDELRVFTTVYYTHLRLYDKTLFEAGGGVVPAAIVYVKNKDGTYSYKEYIEAKDGSYFRKSIEDFCKPRKDIADAIMKHYGNYDGLFEIMRNNLTNYLRENNMKGINLKENSGEIVPLT